LAQYEDFQFAFFDGDSTYELGRSDLTPRSTRL
jgi:hypothetical protein